MPGASYSQTTVTYSKAAALYSLTRAIYSKRRAIYSKRRAVYSLRCAVYSLTRTVYSLARAIYSLTGGNYFHGVLFCEFSCVKLAIGCDKDKNFGQMLLTKTSARSFIKRVFAVYKLKLKLKNPVALTGCPSRRKGLNFHFLTASFAAL